MNLVDLDCSGMVFNPRDSGFIKNFTSTVPGVSVRNVSPVKEAPLFKYVVLMYDPSSPVVRTIGDYWQRKLECVEAAGFKVKADGSLEQSTEDWLIGKNDGVIDVIIDFLAYIKSPTWNLMVFMQEKLLRYTNDALSSRRNEDIKVNEVYQIGTRLQELNTKFIGENIEEETKKFLVRLRYRVEEKRLGIRPEDYAKRLAQGDDLAEDSPYGPTYRVSKIKFKGNSVCEQDTKKQISI
jgi:hypothetical protein